MLQEERYDQILTLLAERGYLRVHEVVEMFAASPATVRRDFNELAKRKLVEKTRGGIRLERNRRDDGAPPLDLLEARHSREKIALARRAAALLKPNDAIILEGGTTTLHLAKNLPDYPLTVITNSIPHAQAIGELQATDSRIEILLAGGTLYLPWSLTLGPQTRHYLSQYYAHWVFLSGQGINEQGLFNPSELVVETLRTMIANADKVVVMADHSKIGSRSMCLVCTLQEIDILITDEWPEHQQAYEFFREAGIEVVTVRV